MHVKLCDLAHAPGRHHHLSQALPAPKEHWNAAAMAQAKAEIEKHLAILERQLAGKQYLVADEFGLADICYIPGLDFLPLMENRAAARHGGVARAAPGAADRGGDQAGRVTGDHMRRLRATGTRTIAGRCVRRARRKAAKGNLHHLREPAIAGFARPVSRQ
jgi:glutathione S-transferase